QVLHGTTIPCAPVLIFRSSTRSNGLRSASIQTCSFSSVYLLVVVRRSGTSPTWAPCRQSGQNVVMGTTQACRLQSACAPYPARLTCSVAEPGGPAVDTRSRSYTLT